MSNLPEKGNIYYNRPNIGVNPCIRGNYPYDSKNPTGWPGLNVLPNCTGWATGRFNEKIGKGTCKYLGKGDAKAYYSVARKQGLKTGSVPKIGACVVWDDGSYGHVAIVEEIIDEETIIVSQSGWYSRVPMWRAKHKRGNGNWTEGGDAYWMKKYCLIGFVYPPEEEDMTKAETEALIKTMTPSIVKEVLAEIKAETAKLPEDDWAKEAINMNIAKGIMVGYPDGFHPQSDIRREEVACVTEAMMAYIKEYLSTIKE